MKARKKELRVLAKTLHLTLHKITNESKDFWIEKAKTFRSNVVAVLVGLEENHEEDKGVHVHIILQFSTRQDLSRPQFVKHFGTDSLHIATKPTKDALMMALGYVSKTGNTLQYGEFMYRGVKMDDNPEVYRFNYQVKNIDDGLAYFHKIIEENLNSDRNIIDKYAQRKDAIGIWLQKHSGHANTLKKLAYTWYLKYCNEQKKGFKYESFTNDAVLLKAAYRTYLQAFPALFEKHLPKYSKLVLERDYDAHSDHDVEVLRKVIGTLQEAQKYGHKRPHKSLNIHIWSKSPSFGKTRLMKYLNHHMMTYRLPEDQYYVDYENGLYQILISDEATNFIKTKSYSHLKLILEGDDNVEFNRKGKEKVIKEDNPLIVLADNESFDQVMERYFKGLYDKAVMETRVLDLELRSRATLHFLLDRCLIPLQ